MLDPILFSTIKMKSESYDTWTGFKMLSFELVFSELPELLCRLDGDAFIFNPSSMCEFYGSKSKTLGSASLV